MKKFLARLERAIVSVLVRPDLRPAEHALAVSLARSILVRIGASGAVVALIVELIDRVVK